MKMEVKIALNLKVEEVQRNVQEATRLSMRDTVVDVTRDAVNMSPVRTGNNRRSIKGEVGPGGEIAQGNLEGAVYSTSGYGGYLETGTRYMGGHPYLKPALDMNFTQEKFTEKVRGHLK